MGRIQEVNEPIGVRLWRRLPEAEQARLLDMPWREYVAEALRIYGRGVRAKGKIYYIWPVIPARFPWGPGLIVSHDAARRQIGGKGFVVFTVEDLSVLTPGQVKSVYEIKMKFGEEIA